MPKIKTQFFSKIITKNRSLLVQNTTGFSHPKSGQNHTQSYKILCSLVDDYYISISQKYIINKSR